MMLFLVAFQAMPFGQAVFNDPIFKYAWRGAEVDFYYNHPATKDLLIEGLVDEDLAHIIFACFNPNPMNRPEVSEIFTSSYVQGAVVEITAELRQEIEEILQ
jgi:hypothetical protein